MLKKIISNTLFQLLAKAIAVSLTFLTTVLIIRLGGPELYGDLTKALALIAIGFTAIDFGLNAEAVRSMSGKFAHDRPIFQSTLLARGLLSLVAILSLNAVIYFLPGGYTPGIKAIFWLGSLAILFQGLYTSGNAWFQRRLEYWKMSLATVIGTLVGTILTYFAVLRSPTLGSLLAASTVGYAVMGICSLLLVPHPLPLTFKFRPALSLIKRSLPLGAILLLSILASKVDSIILGVFRSSSEVGQYGFAYRIFDVILVLPVFVMNAVYPLLIGNPADRKKSLIRRTSLTLLIVGLLAALLSYLLAPALFLIRPGLELSILSLRLLAFSLPLFYLTAPLMWQLIEARLEKYLLLVYGLAALFNGITNLIFVPLYGAAASALLTGLTETTILIGLFFVRKKFYET